MSYQPPPAILQNHRKQYISALDRYDEIDVEAKHMVIARLVDRIEVGKDYTVHIQLKVALEQLIAKIA